MKRGQISLEMIMLFGFVLIIIAGILTVSIVYNTEVQDTARLAQTTNFANKIISSAETISYAGPKARTTLTLSLPTGVEKIEIIDSNIVMTVSLSNGINVMAFSGNVNITGELNSTAGIKKIKLINRGGQDKTSVEIKQTFQGDDDNDTLLDHLPWANEEDGQLYECDDGVDNDYDGLVDMLDPGCTSPTEDNELGTVECDDGVDNDGDGDIDYPNDHGCTSPTEDNELGTVECDDGVDNDGDGDIDYPNDPECDDSEDDDEEDFIGGGGLAYLTLLKFPIDFNYLTILNIADLISFVNTGFTGQVIYTDEEKYLE